ncbi:MAG: NAD(P)/FAD-dependent oxidoreductase [Dysgonamonadaceae bacterium]|jgi:protoporphyrinogen oxidase|nr:NAD(P)/FAD-dependent oxidoreductase [Dysgonamonadaceae bacterium]
MHKKQVAIIGAGPAGLTAGYELAKLQGFEVTVLEEDKQVGGISKTIRYKGNRMDIGGHRFFSKDDDVMQWWANILPLQGKPSEDDILLNRKKDYAPDGPDPELIDRVMLLRQRVSRIFYLRKFFDYPISLKFATFANMGLVRTLKAGFGYIWANISKRKEDSLENFYINRFGKPLYKMFFENYTEKVWGQHPSKLGADWGSQRVKGLSVAGIIKDIITKPFRSKDISQKNTETSLIESFIYPKFGPGQLWETVEADIQQINPDAKVLLNHKVTKINVENNRVVSITALADGKEIAFKCNELLSSMPIKDLVAALQGIDIPEDVKKTAENLPYRDFITVGLLVDKLQIKNETKIKTLNNLVPDTWIYIQEPDVKIGRLQIFNNWSPYMVEDFENKVWIGLEYFCNEGDEMWNMSDDEFIKFAENELEKTGFIRKEDILDGVRARIKKAYPSYYGSYYDLPKVIDFLNSIENLYCIGRNGQHRYNNQDHSMLTAMEAVKNIKTGNNDKSNIWSVNTEKEYHEKRNS